MKRLTLLAIVLVVCGAGKALADPITYTIQVTASGALGGTAFSGALVAVTFAGDTANVYYNVARDTYVNKTGTATVTIEGIGTAIFTDLVTGTAVNHSTGGVPYGTPTAGISDFTLNAAILFASDPAFATYDLTTVLAPVSGTPSGNLGGVWFPTTGGDFVLTEFASDATYSAAMPAAVPEPASIVLLASGLLAVGGLLRGNRRS